MKAQAKARWVVDPVHSSIEFAVRHMVIATVRGRFEKFNIEVQFDEDNPEKSSVEVRVDSASIDTRERERDTHLRSPDFLDVERFPELVFVSRRVESLGGGRFSMVGDLTIRDVTREAVLDTEFAGTAKDPWGKMRAGFNAETSLSRKDFGLEWNVALEAGGWLVGDTVKIFIEAELVKQEQ